MDIVLLFLVILLPAVIAWVALHIYAFAAGSTRLVDGMLLLAVFSTLLPPALLASGFVGAHLPLPVTLGAMGASMLLAYVLLIQVLYGLDHREQSRTDRVAFTLTHVRQWIGFMLPLGVVSAVLLGFLSLPSEVGALTWVWVLGVPLSAFTAVYVIYPAVFSWVWSVRPLPPGPLREQLLQVVQESRIALSNIGVIQGNHPERMVASATGILPWFRQVCLHEDFIRNHSPEQVRAVFAHELGHLYHNHLAVQWVLSIATASLSAAAMFATKALFPDTMSAFVLRSLLFTAVTMTIVAWVSRRNELVADWYACQLTKDPDSLLSCLEQLKRSHSPRYPGLLNLWNTHPSPDARIDNIIRTRSW